MTIQQDNIQLLLSELAQQPELSIIKLSEPILSQSDHQQQHRQHSQQPNDNQRTSDASSNGGADVSTNPTPASLDADLIHYKELFTKLRFSYVEQVTKEKFLRAVVGDPPIYVSAAENTALETELFQVKASLKAQKDEIGNMIADLERVGRELSGKYAVIQAQTEQLRVLPGEIEGLQQRVEGLRRALEVGEEDPVLGLPLQGTLEAVGEKEDELAALDHELEVLESEGERKMQELGKLEDEVRLLQAQKSTVTAAARDARRRNEKGPDSVGDELEQRGRWLRGVEATMRSLLDVER